MWNRATPRYIGGAFDGGSRRGLLRIAGLLLVLAASSWALYAAEADQAPAGSPPPDAAPAAAGAES